MNGEHEGTTPPGTETASRDYPGWLTIYSDEVTDQLDRAAMRLGREPRFKVTGQSWDEARTVRHVTNVVLIDEDKEN